MQLEMIEYNKNKSVYVLGNEGRCSAMQIAATIAEGVDTRRNEGQQGFSPRKFCL